MEDSFFVADSYAGRRSKQALEKKAEGNGHFAAGRFEDARRCFTEAIELDSSSAVLYSNRSGALASLGRHEEALSDADRCVLLQTGWWKGHSRRGHACFHLNRLADSEAAFLEAQRLQPGEPSVAEGLEQVRAAMRKSSASGAEAKRLQSPLHRIPSQPPKSPACEKPSAEAAATAAGASGGGLGSFRRLDESERRQRLERGVNRLSDAALDEQLRAAGVAVFAGLSREEKERLFLAAEPSKPAQAPKPPEPQKKGKPKLTPGEELLLRRTAWLEKWEKWDEAQLLKRLRHFGVDGTGQPRAVLLEELLTLETEAYESRCSPERVQKCAFLSAVGMIFLFLLAVVVFLVMTGA